MSIGDLWRWLVDPANWQGSDGIPTRLGEQVHVSVESVAIGAAIALPVGVVLGHYGRFGNLAINVSNVGRAVPSFGIIVIAFLAFGLGDGPIVLALTALAIPPMVTNSYVALREVDPDIKEAARGMGYRELAQVLRVELPLAVPLIMAGVRTAAVQVVIGNHPIRIVIKHHAARPIIDATGDKYFSHVFVAAARVSAPRLETGVVRIPAIVVGVVRVVPALVFPVVMTVVIAIFVLVPAFMLAVVVVVVAILRRRSDRQCSRQGHENHTCQDFSHRLSLQRLR